MIVEMRFREGSDTVFHDITQYLDDDSDVLIDSEIERDAFERTVEDLRLRCSDQDGFFSDIFKNVVPTERMEVRVVHNSKILFDGEVDLESIEFTLGAEWVEFDCFSMTKLLWDRAKELKVKQHPIVSTSETLALFLPFLLQDIESEGIFSGHAIAAEYQARSVRIRSTLSGGTEFSYRDPATFIAKMSGLDPDTTIETMLLAMSFYYNAEFFINPETQMFTMNKRGAILNDTQTDLDAILLEEGSDQKEYARLQWIDDRRVEYIKTVFFPVAAGGLTLISVVLVASGGDVWKLGLRGGASYQYVMTSVLANGEAISSSVFLVSIAGEVRDNRDAFAVTLGIPAGFSGATARRVYRQDNVPSGTFFLMQEFAGNTPTTYEDRNYPLSLYSAKRLETENATSRLNVGWIKYDEALGTWDAPIVDNGQNAPTGKILDVIPQGLRFYNGYDLSAGYVQWALREASPKDYSDFFMNDNTLDVVQNEYLDMFRTKRRGIFSVNDIGQRIGDTLISHGNLLPNDLTFEKRYLIKKAEINLTKEEAHLVAISL